MTPRYPHPRRTPRTSRRGGVLAWALLAPACLLLAACGIQPADMTGIATQAKAAPAAAAAAGQGAGAAHLPVRPGT